MGKQSGKTPKGAPAKPRCGLCGKAGPLLRTECCGNWICRDSGKYVMFSFARNSCFRNHGRYTLCGFHRNESHPGRWQDCPRCREEFETEMYVHYGTNEHNFEKLANPPSFKPTRCSRCKKVIVLAGGGCSRLNGAYHCGRCTAEEFDRPSRRGKDR